MTTREVNSLIVVSDLHVGCQLGLCPRRATLDHGGTYRPSSFQRKLWAWWIEFWTSWVPLVTRGDTFGVVLNGDAMDRRHHNATHQWTHNLADQQRVAYEILAPVVEQCDGNYWHIRGTEAHSGPSGENEEELAHMLGAVKSKEGLSARFELWKYVHGRQALVHILHHIGTTGSQHFESTGIHKELLEALGEAGRWGTRPPDVVVRSHRHRMVRTEVASRRERAVGIVTPGWQGKTPFIFRIAGGRQSQPQFGGILIRVSEEGELYVRHKVHGLERPTPE